MKIIFNTFSVFFSGKPVEGAWRLPGEENRDIFLHIYEIEIKVKGIGSAVLLCGKGKEPENETFTLYRDNICFPPDCCPAAQPPAAFSNPCPAWRRLGGAGEAAPELIRAGGTALTFFCWDRCQEGRSVPDGRPYPGQRQLQGRQSKAHVHSQGYEGPLEGVGNTKINHAHFLGELKGEQGRHQGSHSGSQQFVPVRHQLLFENRL